MWDVALAYGRSTWRSMYSILSFRGQAFLLANQLGLAVNTPWQRYSLRRPLLHGEAKSGSGHWHRPIQDTA